MADYALMNQCLYEGKAKEVEQMTRDALAEGRTVQEVLNEGLIAGMSVVGEDFKHNILYVPEVLIAARAMKAGMAVLKPLLSAKDGGAKPHRHPADGHGARRPARHRQEPGLHDGRGRRLRSARHRRGSERREIHGRRREVQPRHHRHERAAHHHHDLHEDRHRWLRRGRPRHIKMAIGGAPISQMFADEIGADGYGPMPPPRSICSCGWRQQGNARWRLTRFCTGRNAVASQG